jgi:hypothetical protein
MQIVVDELKEFIEKDIIKSVDYDKFNYILSKNLNL